jgi:hypothetical protein
MSSVREGGANEFAATESTKSAFADSHCGVLGVMREKAACFQSASMQASWTARR